MKLILSILLLALTSFSHAATLELVFNESSFSSTTTGTFRLTGQVAATGYGSGGFYADSTYYNQYHSFSSQYTPAFTAPSLAPFDFFLSAYPSAGTAVRDSVTYLINGDYGISLNIFHLNMFSGNLMVLQIYLQDQPNPNFGPENYLPDYTQGSFLVDISGSFVANANAGGAAPSTQGVDFGNLAGTQVNQYTPETSANALTISVPEPSTASLLLLSALPLLFRRRKIS